MTPVTVAEACRAMKGSYFGGADSNNLTITGVSTDTRNTDMAGSLFFPLSGDNFDGHVFIGDAFQKGAVCTVTERQLASGGEHPHIVVASAGKALMDFAAYYLNKFRRPVVAVTGSSGKTTTKDMIASVLSKRFRVLKTEGNFNNQIGLPLTLFGIEESTEAVVLEMGMNAFGEIRSLSKIAQPDICVVTNIGVAHIETLGSREGILQAKSEIFEYMKEGGCAILNGDDDMLCSLADKPFKKYFFSLNKNSDKMCSAHSVCYNGTQGSSAEISFLRNRYPVEIPLPGRHMVYNAMAAVAVGALLGLTAEEIQAGIRDFKPSGNRMKIVDAPGGYRIINDVYNANPQSMEAAFDMLLAGESSGRKVCIMGDMLELGGYGEQMHRDTGRAAVMKGIGFIICIGPLSRYSYEGAVMASAKMNPPPQAVYFESKEDFMEHCAGLFAPGDTILVKASRGMAFEKIVEKLTR